MKDTWYQARQKVVMFARKLQAERLVYSTAGNISMRIPGDPELLTLRAVARLPRAVAARDPWVAANILGDRTGRAGDIVRDGRKLAGRVEIPLGREELVRPM